MCFRYADGVIEALEILDGDEKIDLNLILALIRHIVLNERVSVVFSMVFSTVFLREEICPLEEDYISGSLLYLSISKLLPLELTWRIFRFMFMYMLISEYSSLRPGRVTHRQRVQLN